MSITWLLEVANGHYFKRLCYQVVSHVLSLKNVMNKGWFPKRKPTTFGIKLCLQMMITHHHSHCVAVTWNSFLFQTAKLMCPLQPLKRVERLEYCRGLSIPTLKKQIIKSNNCVLPRPTLADPTCKLHSRTSVDEIERPLCLGPCVGLSQTTRSYIKHTDWVFWMKNSSWNFATWPFTIAWTHIGPMWES